MQITGDYHTHTVDSRRNHAKGTIAENAAAAYEKGLKELAICDHGPGHFLYGVLEERIPMMRQEIDAVNEEYKDKDFRVLLGVEANVRSYNGDWDLKEELLPYFDLTVAGFHYGVLMNDLWSNILFFIMNPLAKLIKPMRPWVIEKNTDALVKLVENYPVTFLSHPGDKVPVDAKRLAETCAEYGVHMEINAHHPELSEENIKKAMETDVTFIINSDAHKPEHIATVEEGIQRAKNVGLPASRIVNVKE